MLACERPEDELRHRHVRRGVDAVPRHVPENDGEPSVLEREEVVDVAADLDARRRLVHLAHLEPLDDRPRAREERALHRVGELLLLLVQAGVVDREGRLGRECRGRVDRLLREWVAGPKGEDAERGDDLGRQGDGDDGRRPTLLEEWHERRKERLAAGSAGLEPKAAPVAEKPLHVPPAERDRLVEDCADRRRELRVPDVDCPRQELLTSLVRRPHDGGVEVEHLDDGACERGDRFVEGEALRERPGHLVEGAEAPCRRPLGGERRLPLLSETGRLLVELRVLDRDRELPGERRQERRLVLTRPQAAPVDRRRAGR